MCIRDSLYPFVASGHDIRTSRADCRVQSEECRVQSVECRLGGCDFLVPCGGGERRRGASAGVDC
eukprot:1187121-Prorocentrum_minimum.AAC.7